MEIFDILKKIENADVEWYETLDDKEKTNATSIVIQRWLYGTSNVNQILNLSQINKLLWKFPVYHKDLLFKLLCASIKGKGQRYKWYKMPKSSSQKNQSIISEYYSCTEYEADQIKHLITDDDLKVMELALGRNKK